LTAIIDVQKTRMHFLMMLDTVMPTSVLPAPHGSTKIEECACKSPTACLCVSALLQRK
jgi:hypothetical protein